MQLGTMDAMQIQRDNWLKTQKVSLTLHSAHMSRRIHEQLARNLSQLFFSLQRTEVVSYVQESQSAFEEVCRAVHAELLAARSAVASHTAYRAALLRRIEAATKTAAELLVRHGKHANARSLPPGQPTAGTGTTSYRDPRQLPEPRLTAGAIPRSPGQYWHRRTAQAPASTYTWLEQSTRHTGT